MRLAELRLEVSAGDGLVARWGGCVLAVFGDAGTESAQELAAIVKGVATEQADGRVLAHRLAGFMTQLGPGEVPDYCAMAEAERGLVVVLHGAAILRATDPGGEIVLSGVDRPTWVDDYLSSELDRIEVTPDGSWTGTEGSTLDLIEGSAAGGGLALSARAGADAVPVGDGAVAEAEAEPTPEDQEPAEAGAAAAAASEPAVAPPAAEEEPRPFTAIDLTGETEERTPLSIAGAVTEEVEEPAGEVIEGIRCIRGHFNHPQALYCAHCGISMVQQTHVVVQDARPPLGILVFGDGMTVGLDSGYVIGREPSSDADEVSEALRLLKLEDPDQVLSRTHAVIRLVEWDVELVDMNSANGTYVRATEDDDWERLAGGAARRLDSGMQARLGPHQFVYDSHHRPQHA